MRGNILCQPALWDASPTVQLIELHRVGKSYSEIGAALGMTRNAVAGKCKRLGLTAVAVSEVIQKARHMAGIAGRAQPVASPRLKKVRREYTKSELRSMLSEAMANTARLAA